MPVLSTLPALSSRDWFNPSSTSPSERINKTPQNTNSQPSKIEQRVTQLGKNTLDLAQNLLGSFASQLLGDSAKGMQVSFSDVELSASSEANMSLSQRSSGTSSSQSASFNLNDRSSFVGKGTITTADGQRFEFELEVSYESRQSATYTQQTTQTNSIPPQQRDKPNTSPQTDGTKLNYQGIAADLLQSLSAEPIRLPFKNNSDETTPREGDLALKLLNLAGGDRYLNWFGATEPTVDQTA
ncbi:hypothetical protein HZU75_10295 [Chitinibacter fontanus]|uniref:Uncharacterized protein n=1 Tax=Chitinibacter fontanus TaxID=1737446 RepID=A0A7D5VAA9_9NEIS|nr:hypothetical protein [Chitinibacter fontanus]QLI81898.1 hypothetical protein HZU75_10295 [Chitinibacter fontanus]